MPRTGICYSRAKNGRIDTRFRRLMAERIRPGGFYARSWIERLIRPLPSNGSILDLGCGAGEPIARFLVDQGFSVTGIDAAQSQIGLAQTRFPRQRWIKADMRTVALDEQFDAVIAWNSLTWLTHADQALMATRSAEWLKVRRAAIVQCRARSRSDAQRLSQRIAVSRRSRSGRLQRGNRTTRLDRSRACRRGCDLWWCRRLARAQALRRDLFQEREDRQPIGLRAFRILGSDQGRRPMDSDRGHIARRTSVR